MAKQGQMGSTAISTTRVKRRTMMMRRQLKRYTFLSSGAYTGKNLLIGYLCGVQIREGFIVEDDEEPEERARRRQERKKRRREEREEEEAGLDEEDLDLIGEAHPDYEQRATSEVYADLSVAKASPLKFHPAQAQTSETRAQR